MSSPGATAFVGRVDELQRLRDAAAALAHGQSSLVLLEGEAGAGKTRMVEELRCAAAAGALEYVRAPYAPVRDLLASLDRRFPKVLKKNATLSEALRPIMELRPPDEGIDADGRQRQLLDAVVTALSKYSALEPLVVAIEDVHWIDRASADVLEHVARNLSGTRAVLIVTYRGADTMEREESRTLVSHLTRLSSVVLALKPLSNAEAMLLINEAAPETLPLSLRRAICELAQGSPLLILELTRHVADDPNALATSLPVSLQALVQDRLSHFDERDRDILRVCAAMETFDPAMVSKIAGVNASAVMTTLRKARSAGLVAESGPRFVFRHALMRRAVTDDIFGIELAALHARIGEYLEARSGDPQIDARLAYHFWMARDIERSGRYNVVAAEHAVSVYAYDDAAALYERAIAGRLLDAGTFYLYRKLGELYEAGSRFKQAVEIFRTLFSFARQERPKDEAARIAMDLSRCCFHALDDEGSINAIREALEIAPENDPALRFDLYALLAWYTVHLRRLHEARDALEAAEPLREHGASIARVRYHEARAAYEVHAHGGGSWRDEVEAALLLADELDATARLKRFGNAIALSAASHVEDFAYASELIERAEALIAQNSVNQLSGSLATFAWIHYICGRLREARAAVQRMLPYVNDNPMNAFHVAWTGIPLALRTGDEALLRACARRHLLQEAFASKDPVVFGPVASAVADQLYAQGRADEARALVDRAVNELAEAGNNFELLIAAARLGSAQSAARALKLLEPWSARSRSAKAAMALIVAYQSKGRERIQAALACAEGFASLPWPLHQAQGLELAGETGAAAAVYRECGAWADAARLEREQTGSIGCGVLSKREMEVAKLVAEGLSNRAIAERLVLSERTIENHVAAIFTKLNMRSRAEIASFIARADRSSV